MVVRFVSLLVFLVISQCVNGQNYHCRATSCLICPRTPINCVVTPIGEYSYNYVCQAPSQCRNVPIIANSSYGFFCFFYLNITSGNTITFFSLNLRYPSFSCSTGFNLNCSSGTMMKVSSFEMPNLVYCSCFEENCQSTINVTLFIDPPDDEENVSSFDVLHEVTSSIEPFLTMIPSISSTINSVRASLTTSTVTAASLFPSIAVTSLTHSLAQSTSITSATTRSTSSLTLIGHSSNGITSSIPRSTSSIVSFPQSTNSLTSVSTRSITESVVPSSTITTSTAAVTIGLACK